MTPPCLDCGEPLTAHPGSSQYPKGTAFSGIYLCPFCRTHRYSSERVSSERVAMARCWVGLEKRRATTEVAP